MSVVLDASSIIAVLLDEPGAEYVVRCSREGHISTVNLAEVYERAERAGISSRAAFDLIQRLEIAPEPFEVSQALLAASFRKETRHLGLSFGDRACLALAKERSLPAITADRKWAELDIGIAVQLIR